MENFFRFATAFFLIGGFAISGYFRTRAQIKGGKLRSKDGTWPLLLMRFVGLALWVPIIAYIINPDTVTWARINLPDGVRVGAVFVLIINSGLTFWMFRSLSTNISPVEETREHATLVTNGPYRYIRHPLYSFGFILLFALTILTAMWWVLVGALFFLIFILWRTPREEAKLIEVFGDAYRSYMQRTGRFLPKLG